VRWVTSSFRSSQASAAAKKGCAATAQGRRHARLADSEERLPGCPAVSKDYDECNPKGNAKGPVKYDRPRFRCFDMAKNQTREAPDKRNGKSDTNAQAVRGGPI
jgi:hypothetical protein